MKVLFKQAVHLDGKSYSRGVHEVPEQALQHKYFHTLLKAGLVSDPEAPPVEVLTDKQRQDRLAEKVLANAAKAIPKAPAADIRSVPKALEPAVVPPVVKTETSLAQPDEEDESDDEFEDEEGEQEVQPAEDYVPQVEREHKAKPHSKAKAKKKAG